MKDADRIRRDLERLLASSQFRTSKRCQMLLQYVAEHALSGDILEFKERTLGVSVFGRAPDYDTNQDPVVRTTAGEIRKKLAQYYQTPGHDDEVKVVLLPGSYIPEFHVPEEPQPQAAARRQVFPRRFVWPSLIAVVALALAVVALRRFERSPLDLFWGRVTGSPDRVLLCPGQPAAYNFRSDKLQTEIGKMIEQDPARLAALTGQVPLKQLVPMPDRYLAYGDVVCLLRLVSLLDRKGKRYEIKGASAATFNDLREGPSILIGAYDNDWTLRFLAPLRFTFYKNFDDPKGVLETVRDRDHPEHSFWHLTNSWPYWNISADYGIIARVLDPATDRIMIIAAGITHFGTMAAGEFLTDPEYFAQALPLLPKDWARKNVEVLLQVPVVHGSNGRPRVLAAQTW